MAAGEHDGDSGYDGSNTTGFVSPAADALEGSEGPSLRKRTVRNENTGEILPISSEKS